MARSGWQHTLHVHVGTFKRFQNKETRVLIDDLVVSRKTSTCNSSTTTNFLKFRDQFVRIIDIRPDFTR